MSKKRILVIICIVFVVLTALSIWFSAHGLTVSHYTLPTPNLTAPVRIVQLTDLHNSEFGEHNIKLIDKITEQAPDLILLTGDMLNQDENKTEVVENLISRLINVAPVYISYGNHETVFERSFDADLTEVFQRAGATVLNFSWQDIVIKGQDLRIGGLFGYCLQPKYLESGEANEKECEFLSAFQDTPRCRILLCHMPVCWIINDSLDYWDIDCVFAGHAHGGQVRIPLIGGLVAPDQGWFPGQMCGIYSSQDGTSRLVLSRGLGSRRNMPRFNNIPEILVADLVPG